MTEVCIEVRAADLDTCLDHRDKLQDRATQLGFPPAHSGGAYLSDPPIVDLQWTLINPDPDRLADVIAVLRQEFDVHNVSVHEADELDRSWMEKRYGYAVDRLRWERKQLPSRSARGRNLIHESPKPSTPTRPPCHRGC
jgi:hypothetical protein